MTEGLPPDDAFWQGQRDQLRIPRIAPITDLVDTLSRQPPCEVPYVAPMYGGVEAWLLTVLASPGRQTRAAPDGTGFLCIENPDPAAAAAAQDLRRPAAILPGRLAGSRPSRSPLRRGHAVSACVQSRAPPTDNAARLLPRHPGGAERLIGADSESASPHGCPCADERFRVHGRAQVAPTRVKHRNACRFFRGERARRTHAGQGLSPSGCDPSNPTVLLPAHIFPGSPSAGCHCHLAIYRTA